MVQGPRRGLKGPRRASRAACRTLVPRPEDLFLNESKRSFPCNDGSCPCANALPTKGVKNHKEKGKEKGEEKGKEKGKE